MIKKKKRKRKAVPTSLPKKKHTYNTPDGGPHGNSQQIGAVNCCCEDLRPRGCRDPKCNPTES